MMAAGGPALAPTTDTDHRRRLIGYWLRSTVDPEEAEAMASGGYRSFGCGGCCRRGCRACDVDPAERVFGSRGGRRTNYEPAFVRAVNARVSRFPAELVQRAQPAMQALPPDQRIIVLLADGQGLDFSEIARRLKISRQTVSRAHAGALDTLVAAVWPPTHQEATP